MEIQLEFGRKIRMQFNSDPVHVCINLLSKKWNYEILRLLMQEGDCRFTDFEKACPDISGKMLSLRLKELYDDNLISKVISKMSPLEFKYRLSKSGNLIRKLLVELGMLGAQIYDLSDKKYSYAELKEYFTNEFIT